MKQYDLLNKTASAGVDWDLRFQILFLIQTTIVLHLVALKNIFLKRDSMEGYVTETKTILESNKYVSSL